MSNQDEQVEQREEHVTPYLETASGRRKTPSSLAEEALSAAAPSLLPSSVIESRNSPTVCISNVKIIKNYYLLLQASKRYLFMVSKRECVAFVKPPETFGSD